MTDQTFYTLEPEQFPKLALDAYTPEALREMAYFLWSMYPDNLPVMAWRKEKLLPILKPDVTASLDEEFDEEEDEEA